MQDLFPIPSCFSPSPTSDNPTATDDAPSSSSTTTKLGQSIAMSTYRAIISNHPHLVTITWCKNLLTLSLYLSIQPLHVDIVDDSIPAPSTSIKVEMRPWHFWRGRHGSKRCSITHDVDDSVSILDLFWDLKSAKFSSDSDHPEPLSNYYVALVLRDEIVLLLGDLNHDAFRTTGSRPSIFDPVLVSKKEHVFGKRKFVTRTKFEEKGKFHEVSIESRSSSSDNDDEMVIKIDGCVGIEVKHLGWKFRGHESVRVSKTVRVEVYWDVHDWLFSTGGGLRHAIFIFKPMAPPVLSLSSSSSSSSLNSSSSSVDQGNGGGRGSSTINATDSTSSDFCLFLYAWKLE